MSPTGPLLIAAATLLAGVADDATSTPPVARKIPWTMTIHGDTILDDYHWLRERDTPEVLAYLRAENAYADAMTARLAGLRQTLYKEMLGRIKEDDAELPTRDGDYFYYTRSEAGKQYALYCRKRGSPDAPEEVYLDLNALAEGHPFLGTNGTAVSDDGRILAYEIDYTGNRLFTLYFKDLATGRPIADTIPGARAFTWASDNQTVFYATEDDAKRPYRIFRHTLGTGTKDDVLLYEEADETYRVYVRRTRDRRFVVLNTRCTTASEQRVVPADRPTEAPRLLLAREPGHDYDADHGGDRFVILTNKDAPEFRLVSCPEDDVRPAAWAELVPWRRGVTIRSSTLFPGHAVLSGVADGLTFFEVLNLADRSLNRVTFPEPTYSVFPFANPEFAARTFRYRYQSLVSPSSTYEFDLETRQSTLLKRNEVKGGYDPAQYVSERIWATSPDGVRVPISLVRKRTTPLDGSAPLLLYGYGAYGALTPPGFQSSLLSLLDRGMVYAIAHIRGGGDLGKPWAEDGRVLKKQNTFTDFIACADHLVAGKYTARDRLLIRGVSAGGLLIGAVLNQRPDLCKAAVLEVPFVDAVQTMLDPTIPLTVPEFLEWGDPRNKTEYETIKAYCPYTNIAARDYPAMLVRTSYNDSQVQYWEPAKYVARLRALRADSNPMLLKINMDAGHGGASGRYDALRETAFLYAYLLDQAGLRE